MLCVAIVFVYSIIIMSLISFTYVKNINCKHAILFVLQCTSFVHNILLQCTTLILFLLQLSLVPPSPYTCTHIIHQLKTVNYNEY